MINKIIGIDLGTSTSEVAVLENGKPVVIANADGESIIPSIVGIAEDGNVIVGKLAKEQIILRPQHTVREVKRMMGTNQKVEIGGEQYTSQQISAYIIEYVKEYAEQYLGHEVTQAVITVPAYFTDEQRRVTVEAGKLAGLKVERIINEPTSAALAYGIENMENNQHVLVYDLGGGTLDVSTLEMFEGVLEVKASSGNNQLGGKDFDQRLIDMLLHQFEQRYSIDLSKDIHAMARIKVAAEECKIALSNQNEYEVVLPFIAKKDEQPVELKQKISKEQFENLIRDLVESTEKSITTALQDAKLTATDIDTVLLVGGSTRIPMIKEFLKTKLKREPKTLVDPELAVVLGAAVQAGIINQELSSEKDILITDVCPYTLGIETMDIIGGMPLTDVYDVIIPRNMTIPVMREKIYTTVADNQEQVEIKVYQGDYKKASYNHFLGKFILNDIPTAPAGTERIKVRFTYDANGILQIEGIIVSTNKQVSITIETTGVELEEIDLNQWKQAPKARKYRPILRRAERILENEESMFVGELDGNIKDFKKALINEEDERILNKLENELTELLFDMEDE